MALIIQKFGGTSLANIGCIRNVALKVKHEIEQGNQVVVTVSAMAGATDQLIEKLHQVSDLKTKESLAEYDAVVSSGEQVTAGLLALELQSIGIKARSWLAWQLKFNCDAVHSKSRIENIDISKIEESLNTNEVAVVAGFQGLNKDNRITTLGRGGTDTTAVALAVVLKADRCDIYTDVDGIYTTDPRIVKDALKLSKITYEEMIEMSSLGAKVMQTRSVEMAMKYNVNLRVLSSFSNSEGTYITNEEKMEKMLITGIALNGGEASITLKGIKNNTVMSECIFGPLANASINVDMIVKTSNDFKNISDITFTVPKFELERTVEIIKQGKDKLKFESITAKSDVAKVSIVGVGIKSHCEAADILFRTLELKNINILAISTSEIKISVLVEEESSELAVKALHSSFELDKENSNEKPKVIA